MPLQARFPYTDQIRVQARFAYRGKKRRAGLWALPLARRVDPLSDRRAPLRKYNQIADQIPLQGFGDQIVLHPSDSPTPPMPVQQGSKHEAQCGINAHRYVYPSAHVNAKLIVKNALRIRRHILAVSIEPTNRINADPMELINAFARHLVSVQSAHGFKMLGDPFPAGPLSADPSCGYELFGSHREYFLLGVNVKKAPCGETAAEGDCVALIPGQVLIRFQRSYDVVRQRVADFFQLAIQIPTANLGAFRALINQTVDGFQFRHVGVRIDVPRVFIVVRIRRHSGRIGIAYANGIIIHGEQFPAEILSIFAGMTCRQHGGNNFVDSPITHDKATHGKLLIVVNRGLADLTESGRLFFAQFLFNRLIGDHGKPNSIGVDVKVGVIIRGSKHPHTVFAIARLQNMSNHGGRQSCPFFNVREFKLFFNLAQRERIEHTPTGFARPEYRAIFHLEGPFQVRFEGITQSSHLSIGYVEIFGHIFGNTLPLIWPVTLGNTVCVRITRIGVSGVVLFAPIRNGIEYIVDSGIRLIHQFIHVLSDEPSQIQCAAFVAIVASVIGRVANLSIPYSNHSIHRSVIAQRNARRIKPGIRTAGFMDTIDADQRTGITVAHNSSPRRSGKQGRALTDAHSRQHVDRTRSITTRDTKTTNKNARKHEKTAKKRSTYPYTAHTRTPICAG